MRTQLIEVVCINDNWTTNKLMPPALICPKKYQVYTLVNIWADGHCFLKEIPTKQNGAINLRWRASHFVPLNKLVQHEMAELAELLQLELQTI